MTERPYRVTVHTLDPHGNANTEVRTYWVDSPVTVLSHLNALERQRGQAGWSTFWGPIGLSWEYLRAQLVAESFAGVVRNLGMTDAREARRFTR